MTSQPASPTHSSSEATEPLCLNNLEHAQLVDYAKQLMQAVATQVSEQTARQDEKNVFVKKMRAPLTLSDMASGACFHARLISSLDNFYCECRSSALLRVALLIKRIMQCDKPDFGKAHTFRLCELSARLCGTQAMVPYEYTDADHDTDPPFLPSLELIGTKHNEPAHAPHPGNGRKARKIKHPRAAALSCFMYIDESYRGFCTALWLVFHVEAIYRQMAQDFFKHTANATPDAFLAAHADAHGHAEAYAGAVLCVARVVHATRQKLYAGEGADGEANDEAI